MFAPSATPRVFALPPGADFPARVADGIIRRLEGQPPEALARVEIHVNTRRMQRRLADLLAGRGPRLLPRLRLVTDLGADPALDLPPAASGLRRRLELARLVRALIAREPDLAPASAAFALADSLAGLIDEMAGEGVPLATLERLDLGDLSAHWERSRRFLTLIGTYLGTAAPGAEARQRAAVEARAALWAAAPPPTPVLVAGSTGSRGATAAFMAAVARLPQGAVILPGFDFDLPAAAWERLKGESGGLPVEDHPQFRFVRFLDLLGLTPAEVRPWDEAGAPSPARNRLISLALRPAPATDAWQEEGPRLDDLAGATAALTLIEAPGPRAEALAIALTLREAAETGRRAALVTPDRMLTRRVAAALDRWGLVPDDSAGRPLALTPPGRFLLQTAALLLRPPRSQDLIALLKHPIAHSGGDRGPHLLMTREWELHLRRHGPPAPGAGDLRAWAGDRAARAAWAGWVAGWLTAATAPGPLPLADLVERHLALAEAVAAGARGGASALWQEAAGEEARLAMTELAAEADAGGLLTAEDYLALLRRLFEDRPVRDAVRADPRIMIWGTIEARVQGAELLILAGLNEGTWPAAPPPDPWMNRRMRQDAGLLLPERRIGLSAHDFQQAVAAPEVVLTRALRDEEAETVPSRWLNRLTTLLEGVAPAELAAMRRRGALRLAQAAALEDPGPPVRRARRPAPRPPVAARPTRISVTEVQTLIRDPYEIYARHVLRLAPLDPLHRPPDARLRGSAIHKVLEVFLREVWDATPPQARADALRRTARQVLAELAPWPAARAAWAARLDRVADWLVEGETRRQAGEQGRLLEAAGERVVPGTAVTLKGKADRIGILADGTLVIHDYKTGDPPSKDQQAHFDRQLPLLAALAEAGAFGGLGPVRVARVGYISLGSDPVLEEHDCAPGEARAALAGLGRLLAAYGTRARGYLSRRAVERERSRDAARDYDHLARFGEWEATEPAEGEDVG
ncbi:MAG: double-strand break repair protein AddB [Rhodobacteraceae bacterium]|nr:double-strand break repair protein AddB [Paracoccaceae bacterium]